MKLSWKVGNEDSHRVVQYSVTQKVSELKVNHDLDRIYKHLNYYFEVKFKLIIESVN